MFDDLTAAVALVELQLGQQHIGSRHAGSIARLPVMALT